MPSQLLSYEVPGLVQINAPKTKFKLRGEEHKTHTSFILNPSHTPTNSIAIQPCCIFGIGCWEKIRNCSITHVQVTIIDFMNYYCLKRHHLHPTHNFSHRFTVILKNSHVFWWSLLAAMNDQRPAKSFKIIPCTANKI